MLYRLINNRDVAIRRMLPDDMQKLFCFLSKISEKSKNNFAPHQFDLESLEAFHQANNNLISHLVVDISSESIIGYSLLMPGCIKHDINRMKSYNIETNNLDLSWAPCILDEYQGSGVSEYLFSLIIQELKAFNYQRIFLWGGVRTSNKRAVNYYSKLGFKVLGSFQHEGSNLDMVYHF